MEEEFDQRKQNQKKNVKQTEKKNSRTDKYYLKTTSCKSI